MQLFSKILKYGGCVLILFATVAFLFSGHKTGEYELRDSPIRDSFATVRSGKDFDENDKEVLNSAGIIVSDVIDWDFSAANAFFWPGVASLVLGVVLQKQIESKEDEQIKRKEDEPIKRKEDEPIKRKEDEPIKRKEDEIQRLRVKIKNEKEQMNLKQPSKACCKGNYVTFGSYEFDVNEKQDIVWRVLDIQDGKALVISEYGLDCKQYNTSYTSYTDVTWETCSLRKWLNDDFINSAFSDEEKALMPTVTVSADKNPVYSTDPGKATQDRVFLLSIPEAEKYFSSISARKCRPTPYAVANGAFNIGGNSWWWLRSPGFSQDSAADVDSYGTVREGGYSVSEAQFAAIRPAMWIDLS